MFNPVSFVLFCFYSSSSDSSTSLLPNLLEGAQRWWNGCILGKPTLPAAVEHVLLRGKDEIGVFGGVEVFVGHELNWKP